MHTFSEGPTSGQFNSESEINKNKQPIQGFSAVINSDRKIDFTFYQITDLVRKITLLMLC
jgi:hypothetical protein